VNVTGFDLRYLAEMMAESASDQSGIGRK
jgi:hypothetical protein